MLKVRGPGTTYSLATAEFKISGLSAILENRSLTRCFPPLPDSEGGRVGSMILVFAAEREVMTKKIVRLYKPFARKHGWRFTARFQVLGGFSKNILTKSWISRGPVVRSLWKAVQMELRYHSLRFWKREVHENPAEKDWTSLRFWKWEPFSRIVRSLDVFQCLRDSSVVISVRSWECLYDKLIVETAARSFRCWRREVREQPTAWQRPSSRFRDWARFSRIVRLLDVSRPCRILREDGSRAWSWFSLRKGKSWLRRSSVSTSLSRGNTVDGLPRDSK